MSRSTLSPTERTGHVAVSYKDSIFVWGGYKEDQQRHVNMYFSPKELWVYNGFTELWSGRTCSLSDGPPSMSGATATVIGNHLYLFGGYCQDNEGSTNNLYRLCLERYIWERLEPEGPSPFAVDKAASWNFNGKLCVFGGFGHPHSLISMNPKFQFVFDQIMFKGWTNQFYEYDPETNSWSVPSFKGDLPLPRAAHAAVVVGCNAYVFGGRHNRQRMNDLHCLDLISFQWSGALQIDGPLPAGRSWHSLTAVSDDLFLLYGGFTSNMETLGDCWLFNTSALQWQPVEISFMKPRLWHTACLTIHNEVVIFGGSSANILDLTRGPDQPSEIIYIKISPKSLFRLCLDIVGGTPELFSQWCILPQCIQALLNIRHCRARATLWDGS